MHGGWVRTCSLPVLHSNRHMHLALINRPLTDRPIARTVSRCDSVCDGALKAIQWKQSYTQRCALVIGHFAHFRVCTYRETEYMYEELSRSGKTLALSVDVPSPRHTFEHGMMHRARRFCRCSVLLIHHVGVYRSFII